ncbi:MAG: hypothetical protein HFG00_07925 [Oscillibacter sp.]|nr:hypothetical protein [Oscillibacter sp.]
MQHVDPSIPSEAKARRKWPRRLAVIALAAICVLGAELVACRFAEPELYNTIMAPVRWAGGAAWDAVCWTGEALGRAGSAAADQLRETGSSIQQWIEAQRTPPPEAEEVSSLLDEPDLAPPKTLLDPLVSNLVLRGDVEYLTGGGADIAYFNQTDEIRAAQTYGSDPLSTHGCGPTALAMAVSSLTGEIVDPEEMAQHCVRSGYWCRGNGSYLSIVQGVAEDYGLACTPVDPESLDEDDLYTRLTAGEIFVALMTKGHFTKGGHFILLRGETLSGEILVADPASRDRSLIPWDLSLILEELSPSRHNGAPLWALSSGAA